MRIAILLPFVVACLTEHGQLPPGESPPAENLGQQLWETKALPALEAGDCFACHSSADSIGFLIGNDQETVRQNLLSSGRVDLDNPSFSTLLTKGVHEGSQLSSGQTSDILEWLDAE